MPSRSATLRIDSPAAPSRSSSSRATATISRARGVSVSGALEAIAGAQTVAAGPVDGDVEAPGERAGEPGGRERARHDGGAERQRAPDPVHRVVRRHGPRVELAARESRAGAEQQREVGTEPEAGGQPTAAVRGQLDDEPRDERERA